MLWSKSGNSTVSGLLDRREGNHKEPSEAKAATKQKNKFHHEAHEDHEGKICTY
jgi:hypothetical protein